MSEHDPIDLSPLAPDGARWDAIVTGTAAGVRAVLEARVGTKSDPIILLASWRRRVLAAAAAILAVLIPAEIAMEARESRRAPAHQLAVRSAMWAASQEAPSGSEILRALGEPAP